jgi:uncharacterized protein involved in exopolysaccharide biosynthesis
LLGITLVAAVLGTALSFAVRERFTSKVVLFPAVSNSPSRATMMDGGAQDDLLGIGDDEDAQQLLQMLQSNELRLRAEKRFDLYTAYRIDPQGAHHQDDLHKAYDDHVSFEYTKYGSVNINVWDNDPQRASDLANYISEEVDSVWNDMQRTRAAVGVKLLEARLAEIDAGIVQINDSMALLRESGVNDYRTQSERFNQALGEAILKGDHRAVNELDERFRALARYGGPYVAAEGTLNNELWRQGYIRTQIMQAKADLQADLPHKFVVERAMPADKKSYPVRWVMVVVSAISGLMLAMVLLVVQLNLKRLNSPR